MNAKFQIKTSRNIHKPLATAIKRGDVKAVYMAHDLKISPQSLSDHVKRTDAPVKNAVEYSTYLHDSKFNQQMAAIYFDAISMFDPNEWAQQFHNAPYATWFQLRDIEQERLDIGEKVFKFVVHDRRKWTDVQKELAHTWMIDLLKTISLATLMAQQFSEVANYDLVNLSKDFNQKFGGVKYE